MAKDRIVKFYARVGPRSIKPMTDERSNRPI